MPRVLVIDDQPDVRAVVSMVLRLNQFEVVEAPNAEAGLKAFEASEFDLAIVDVFLDGTNGFDLMETMRRRVAGLPIVAISGIAQLDFFSPPAELCDVVRLQKPFRPNELVLAIEAALGSSRLRAGAVSD